MRKFITRLALFIIPSLLFVLGSIIWFYVIKSQTNSEFQQISEYENILMGDSQIQRINPSFFESKTKNLANSAEHFYFTYKKLEQILKNKNHKIKKIILGVSVHSFSPVYDRLFDINSPEGKRSFRRNLYTISPFLNNEFVKPKNLNVSDVVSGVLRKPTLGKFKESTNTNPDSTTINKAFKMHYSIKNNEKKYSLSQQKYLKKIDSTCSSNNIDLFLCSTPYHANYQQKIDSSYTTFFYNTINSLNKTKHINFLFETPLNKYMSDANHLNKVGAEFYSKKINQALK